MKLRSFCRTQNAGKTPKADNTRDDEETQQGGARYKVGLIPYVDVSKAQQLRKFLWWQLLSLPATAAVGWDTQEHPAKRRPGPGFDANRRVVA